MLRWIAAAVAGGILWVQTQAADAADKNLPQPDHVVMVILENHSFDQIMDPSRAPFIHSLAADGALFVNAFAISHPSQPNYFALFSGSTQGVRDSDYHKFDAPNLATALSEVDKSFVGYIETGSPREHNPWESFNDADQAERNLTELPSDFTQLPKVAFIIPNLNHDMHGSARDEDSWLKDHLRAIIPSWLKDYLRAIIPKSRDVDERLVRDGDTWLKNHLSAYVEWAKAHNSLLIVTFDEDDDNAGNHIPTIILGAHVRPGRYADRITHYNLFSTLLAMYALPPFAEAVTSPPIYSIWEE
ncbi:MAG: alkaline phosphatase family protein [Xanthobacteraceae bacterium]